MKAVVGEDCLIIDSLSCSHYVNEMVGLRRIPSNKVCVYRGRVRVSKTWGSEVWYRKQSHKLSFQ